MSHFDKHAWFAIQTRYLREVDVAERLTEREIDVFVPCIWEHHAGGNNLQAARLPAFPGFVFAHADLSPVQRAEMASDANVIRVVSTAKTPISIPDSEIRSIRIALASGRPVHRTLHPAPGMPIQVGSGALAGAQGLLHRVANGPCLILAVPAIGRALAVKLSPDELSDAQAFHLSQTVWQVSTVASFSHSN